MTDLTEELLALVREAYGELIDHLSTDHNHCRETAKIARVLARALGIETTLCSGHRVLTGDAGQRVHDQHSWLLVDGMVLHSPERGVVELVEFDPEVLVEKWRAGPAPPSRNFRVGPR